MNTIKKIDLTILLLICFIFMKCQKRELFTGINQIDKEFTFLNKYVLEDEENTNYPQTVLYYNKSLQDSLYSIGIKTEDGYTLRARGWAFNENRTGDWYFEKIYNDNTIVVDSIINYIIFCDSSSLNTIKKFKNNLIDKSKGNFYEVNMKKEVHVGDTLSININFYYDTLTFSKRIGPFILYKPKKLDDYCDATKYSLDTLSIINNTTTMNFLLANKGKVKFLGYYYLFPKKQNSEGTEVIQVFTEINFEVK